MLKKILIFIVAAALTLALSASVFASPLHPVQRLGEYALIKNIVPAEIPDPRSEQLQIRAQLPELFPHPALPQPCPVLLDEAVTADILATAKSYLGVPYCMGGKTPSGFDCSGFVRYVMNRCGFDLTNVGCCQDIYDMAELIDFEDAQPGDILFYIGTYATGKVSHVGIYLGDDRMIHAGTAGICYADISTDYWQGHYCGVGRLYPLADGKGSEQ